MKRYQELLQIILFTAVKCNRNAFLSIICKSMAPKRISTPYGAKILVSAVECNKNVFLTLCRIVTPYGAKILVSAVKCNRNEFLSIICNTMVPKRILTPYGATMYLFYTIWCYNTC